MRQLKFLLFIVALICFSKSGISQTNSDLPSGSWIPVKQEIGGKELPKPAFESQKLIISDSVYTFIAESVDKGSVKYSENKMDIYGEDGVNAGKHFTAIYKLEDDQLKICYNLMGDSYPETFETKGHSMFFMSVFEKEKSE